MQRHGEPCCGTGSSVKRLVRLVLGRSARPVEPPGPPRLLLFDFDGTIADTFDDGFYILNKLAAEFGFRSLREDEIEKARDMRTRELMKFLRIPMTKMSRIARRGSEELLARMPHVKPLAGVPELLRELHAAGFELGIVTSNSESNVRMFLKKFDLELFSFIRSSSKLMGKASEIRSVMKATKTRPADILFVGDETRDIEASQKAGVRIAAVTWGYNSRRSIEAMKPDYIFDTAEELAALLREMAPKT
jgi:phosphoglycolate phosphatase-like HAD superfamily hydrolase